MKQFTFIKHLKTAIAISFLALAFIVFYGCNNSSTDNSEVKDSTTNTMSDTTNMISTDTLPQFDSLQNRTDTGRGDQTAPPPK